jgi:choline dehydrogenase
MSSPTKTSLSNSTNPEPSSTMADFIGQVRVNQTKLTSDLKPHYDFIVCGSGSSRSVVARRLAENPDVSVLLLEAGGSDDVPSVMEANQWSLNLGSERNWRFSRSPNSHLKRRMCWRDAEGRSWNKLRPDSSFRRAPQHAKQIAPAG